MFAQNIRVASELHGGRLMSCGNVGMWEGRKMKLPPIKVTLTISIWEEKVGMSKREGRYECLLFVVCPMVGFHWCGTFPRSLACSITTGATTCISLEFFFFLLTNFFIYYILYLQRYLMSVA